MREVHPTLCVTCQVSGVTCHVSPVTCHLSHVVKKKLLFILKKIYKKKLSLKKFDKVVELVGGGSVINKADPVDVFLHSIILSGIKRW